MPFDDDGNWYDDSPDYSQDTFSQPAATENWWENYTPPENSFGQDYSQPYSDSPQGGLSQLDPQTVERQPVTDVSADGGETLNAYGQWVDANGNWVRDATEEEQSQVPDDPSLTGGGSGNEVTGGGGTGANSGVTFTTDPDTGLQVRIDPRTGMASNVPSGGTASGNSPGSASGTSPGTATGTGAKGALSSLIDSLGGLKGIIGGVGALAALTGNSGPSGYKNASELRSQIPTVGTWNPQQQAKMDQFNSTPVDINRPRLAAANMPSPIVPGVRGYAMGGPVNPNTGVAPPSSPTMGPLQQTQVQQTQVQQPQGRGGQTTSPSTSWVDHVNDPGMMTRGGGGAIPPGVTTSRGMTYGAPGNTGVVPPTGALSSVAQSPGFKSLQNPGMGGFSFGQGYGTGGGAQEVPARVGGTQGYQIPQGGSTPSGGQDMAGRSFQGSAPQPGQLGPMQSSGYTPATGVTNGPATFGGWGNTIATKATEVPSNPSGGVAANGGLPAGYNPSQGTWNAARDRFTPSNGMPTYRVPRRAYAEGGNVEPGIFDSSQANQGALSRLVAGPGSGQEDMVDAKLSPGEYVWDADSVSALGDGNNAHGAKILDAARENIRRHKRSAPAHKIPPPAKSFMSYMPKKA